MKEALVGSEEVGNGRKGAYTGHIIKPVTSVDD